MFCGYIETRYLRLCGSTLISPVKYSGAAGRHAERLPVCAVQLVEFAQKSAKIERFK
jgi:hypothetical protein